MKQYPNAEHIAKQAAQQSKQQADLAAVEKSKIDVTRCFPQTLDPEHPLNVRAAELWKTLKEQKSPILDQTDAQFIVYSMAAAMLEIMPR